jgi:hypothetical protein
MLAEAEAAIDKTRLLAQAALVEAEGVVMACLLV